MSGQAMELVGTALFKEFGTFSPQRLVTKAVDVSDVCPTKYGSRLLIAYGGPADDRRVAFIVCTARDPSDGVCKVMRLNDLFGSDQGRYRKELYAFAASLGAHFTTLVQLANNHRPA